MSWTPAHSRIDLTAPPAMTPVPGDAGLRRTRPAPATPMTSCVMVVPAIGTVMKLRLASSTVEDHLADALFVCPLGQQDADPRGRFDVAAVLAPHVGINAGGGRQCAASDIVDDLRVDVAGRPEDGQARPLGRALKILAHA